VQTCSRIGCLSGQKRSGFRLAALGGRCVAGGDFVFVGGDPLEPKPSPARCPGSRTSGATMRTENGHTVETAVEARAGFLDRPILTVLIVSTALVIAAFALVFWGVVKF
jgi:hypothetical protein